MARLRPRRNVFPSICPGMGVFHNCGQGSRGCASGQAAPLAARVNERCTRPDGQTACRADAAPPCVNHHASRRGASTSSSPRSRAGLQRRGASGIPAELAANLSCRRRGIDAHGTSPEKRPGAFAHRRPGRHDIVNEKHLPARNRLRPADCESAFYVFNAGGMREFGLGLGAPCASKRLQERELQPSGQYPAHQRCLIKCAGFLARRMEGNRNDCLRELDRLPRTQGIEEGIGEHKCGRLLARVFQRVYEVFQRVVIHPGRAGAVEVESEAAARWAARRRPEMGTRLASAAPTRITYKLYRLVAFAAHKARLASHKTLADETAPRIKDVQKHRTYSHCRCRDCSSYTHASTGQSGLPSL